MYQISKDKLPALFETIAQQQTLYLPISSAGQTNFGVWNPEVQADLKTLKTVKSPKDVFFPKAKPYTPVKEKEKRSPSNLKR